MNAETSLLENREYGGGGTIQTIQQGECVLSECR